jgi:hypothetical protein
LGLRKAGILIVKRCGTLRGEFFLISLGEGQRVKIMQANSAREGFADADFGGKCR